MAGVALSLLGACAQEPAPVSTSEVVVTEVVDGDTLRAFVSGSEERVRLIGINAPEQGECLAEAAADRLGELVADGAVRLERDRSERDGFGRLLRYVYAGDLLVNRVLVEEGLALARRHEPDTSLADELGRAQQTAVASGAGLWAPGACGANPASGIRVGEIRYDPPGDDMADLNEEWVAIENRGQDPVDLSGWSLKDASATHRFSFPEGFTLAPGSTVEVHSGCGDDTDGRLHWCSEGSAVWNNDGDVVFVVDADGGIVASKAYSG